MSLCVQLHNSSISAMDKLVWKLPFWFTKHSANQGKKPVKSKQELPLRIFEQHFVYSIFYCPHSGEEESSSSSSSSSSLKEQGVSPRDAALLDCWLLGASSCPVAKATSASRHNPAFSLDLASYVLPAASKWETACAELEINPWFIHENPADISVM